MEVKGLTTAILTSSGGVDNIVIFSSMLFNVVFIVIYIQHILNIVFSIAGQWSLVVIVCLCGGKLSHWFY